MARAHRSGRITVAMVGWMVWTGSASAQPTVLTYQGQLKQNSSPLTELVDMKFSLFDSDTAETPLAGPIVLDGQTLPAVEVVGGLFSVELDFGSEAFQQGGQWLRIEVRSPHDPSDSGAYSTLDPRQRITATPFALSVPGLSTSEAGVEVAGDIHTSGEVIASAFSSNSPLIFKVNPSNTECARFDDDNCYLGLGTVAPGARLHVGGVAGVDGIMFPDGSLQTSAAVTIAENSFVRNGTTVQPTTNFNISGNGTAGTLNSNGAVTLGGSSQPATALGHGFIYFDSASNKVRVSENNGAFVNLVGATGVSGSGTTNTIPFWSAGTTLGNSQITQNANGVQLPNGVQLAIGAQGYQLAFGSPNGETGLSIAGPTAPRRADLRFDGTTLKLFTGPAGTPPANGIAIDSTGDVGIGTSNPLSKLDISALGEGAELLRFTTERPWVFRQVRTGPSASLQLLSLSGQKRFEITAVAGENVATFFADGANSRVGIGTVDPVARLDVIGGFGNAVVGTHLAGGDTAGVFGFSPVFNGNGVIGQSDSGSSGYGVWGRSAQGIGGYFTGGNYALIADGRARVDLLEIAGADVAEKFLSSDESVEPGTVMEIDTEHPGKLRVARQAYSPCVAGVVSGAGDIPVGAVLGNLPGHEDAPAIALTGRVWVRCDASDAAIAPGDMLTSSNTPGHAMKATDRERAYGTILGKSMTGLARGERGLVLVLVNLQ